MKKLILSILAILLIPALFSCSTQNSGDELIIRVFSIGKADSILISQGGKNVLIDTGEKENVLEIIANLENLNVGTIDKLIITHFDKDHVGGAAAIIDKFGIGEAIQSTFSKDSEDYRAYRAALDENSVSVKEITDNDSFTLMGMQWIINPPQKASYSEKEDNNSSLISILKFGEKSFLFCGDAMEDRIAEFMTTNPSEYDFVKLPYHGNYLDNYKDFAEMLHPAYCAITCSDKNPEDERTLRIFTDLGAKVYLTRSGTITVRSDGSEISIDQK